MSVDNRLSAEQLAALAPGDIVTIESGAEFSRRRYTTGTVTRVDAMHLLVRSSGPRGATYIERYSRRDGRHASGGRGELVNADLDDPAGREILRRRTQRIDVLYREWSRHRADEEALRQLHDAIGEYLQETAVDRR